MTLTRLACLTVLVLLALPTGSRPEARAADPAPVSPPAAEPAPPSAATPAAPQGPAPWPSPLGDPRRQAVPLPAGEGWRAELALDNQGVGVWAVKSFQVFEHLGAPELVALDDQGRLWVLIDYSGRWTQLSTVNDGRWLGGLTQEDLDPRIPGRELYAGSQAGRVWQVVAHPHGALESRLAAAFPDREVHTLVAGDLDPLHAGKELLAFTLPGGVFLLTPTGPDGTFEVRPLGDLRGHVRDAVVLPAAPGQAPEVATVSRDGRVALLALGPEGGRWTTIHEDAMGLGRIALAPPGWAPGPVLFVTHDDGRILRLERAPQGWRVETIYLGPAGPRGIVADRLGGAEDVETVAVYGYGKRVELLTRGQAGWTVETVFQDRDAGHGLCATELDGRNATRELVAAGFGGRVVVLARVPGYGRPGIAASRGD